MFFGRLCTVVAAIVVGFLIATWLIVGSTAGGRGGRGLGLGAIVSLFSETRGSEDAEPAGRGGERAGAPFAPVVDIPAEAAAEAAPEVGDGDYVVGVEIAGESRAYPINILSRPDRHVLNDALGGRPIAVTWCGLCQSSIVYDRRVAGRTLVLFVTGEVYGENMVMRDVGTSSRWPQLLGEAIDGPLEGRSLDPVPSVRTDWKTWRTEHPRTTVVKLSHAIDYYRHDPDGPGESFERRYLSSLQWGLAREGKAVSWPFRELRRQPVVNDSLAGLPLLVYYDAETATLSAFDRRVGETELTFRRGPEGLTDDRTGSIWDPVTGKALRGPLVGRRLNPVPGIITHLRAWRRFHPESESRLAHPA